MVESAQPNVAKSEKHTTTKYASPMHDIHSGLRNADNSISFTSFMGRGIILDLYNSRQDSSCDRLEETIPIRISGLRLSARKTRGRIVMGRTITGMTDKAESSSNLMSAWCSHVLFDVDTATEVCLLRPGTEHARMSGATVWTTTRDSLIPRNQTSVDLG